MLIEDIHPKVVETIKTTITTMLRDYHVTGVDVEVRENSAGEDSIFIDVHYRLNDKPFDPKLSSRVRREVSDRVYKLGDKRFPYIFHHLAEGQGVKA
jgi:hypothetical protein